MLAAFVRELIFVFNIYGRLFSHLDRDLEISIISSWFLTGTIIHSH